MTARAALFPALGAFSLVVGLAAPAQERRSDVRPEEIVEFYIPEEPAKSVAEALRRLELVYQTAYTVSFSEAPRDAYATWPTHRQRAISEWPSARRLIDSVRQSGYPTVAIALHAMGEDPRAFRLRFDTLSMFSVPLGSESVRDEVWKGLYAFAKEGTDVKDFSPRDGRYGAWRLFVRPIPLRGEACLHCHGWGKEGDAAGVIAYAIRPVPDRD